MQIAKSAEFIVEARSLPQTSNVAAEPSHFVVLTSRPGAVGNEELLTKKKKVTQMDLADEREKMIVG